MAMLESAAMYGLLRNADVVTQFKKPEQR